MQGSGLRQSVFLHLNHMLVLLRPKFISGLTLKHVERRSQRTVLEDSCQAVIQSMQKIKDSEGEESSLSAPFFCLQHHLKKPGGLPSKTRDTQGGRLKPIKRLPNVLKKSSPVTPTPALTGLLSVTCDLCEHVSTPSKCGVLTVNSLLLTERSFWPLHTAYTRQKKTSTLRLRGLSENTSGLNFGTRSCSATIKPTQLQETFSYISQIKQSGSSVFFSFL